MAASFAASRVALPKVASSAPLLEDILPMQYQNFFKADSDMLRSQIEVDSLNEALGELGFYDDPRLSEASLAYRAIVRKSLKSGFATLTTNDKSIMGLFFVSKKNGSLRLIGD